MAYDTPGFVRKITTFLGLVCICGLQVSYKNLLNRLYSILPPSSSPQILTKIFFYCPPPPPHKNFPLLCKHSYKFVSICRKSWMKPIECMLTLPNYCHTTLPFNLGTAMCRHSSFDIQYSRRSPAFPHSREEVH